MAAACARGPAPPELAPLGELDPAVRALLDERIAIVARRPADADAWGTLGMAFEANGFTPPARESYRTATTFENAHGRWWYRLGLLAQRGGDIDAGAGGLRSRNRPVARLRAGCAGGGACCCSIAATSRPPRRRSASPSTSRPAMPRAPPARRACSWRAGRRPTPRRGSRRCSSARRPIATPISCSAPPTGSSGGPTRPARRWPPARRRAGVGGSVVGRGRVAAPRLRVVAEGRHRAGAWRDAIPRPSRCSSGCARSGRTIGAADLPRRHVCQRRAGAEAGRCSTPCWRTTPGTSTRTMHLATAHLFAGALDAADGLPTARWRCARRAPRPPACAASSPGGAGRLDDARPLLEDGGRRRSARREGAGVGGHDRGERGAPARRSTRSAGAGARSAAGATPWWAARPTALDAARGPMRRDGSARARAADAGRTRLPALERRRRRGRT